MKDKFIYLLVGAVIVIGTALLLNNQLKSPVVSNKTNGFETPTQTTVPKEVPTGRPEGMPEDWVLYVNEKVGYSFYYPPDWIDISEGDARGVSLSNPLSDHARVITVIIRDTESKVPVVLQIQDIVNEAVYKDRLDRQEEINVSGINALIFREPWAGGMDFVIFNKGAHIFSIVLTEGGEKGGGSALQFPTALADEKTLFQILETFQFAE